MANKKRASRRSNPNKKKATSLSVPSSSGVEIFTPPSSSPPSSERVSGTQSQFHLRYTNQASIHPTNMSEAEIKQVLEEVGIDTSPRKLRRLRRIPGLGLRNPPLPLPPEPTEAIKRANRYAKVDALCASLTEFCTVADEVDTCACIEMADESLTGSENILLKQAQGQAQAKVNGSTLTNGDATKTAEELDEEQRVEDIYQQIQADGNLSSSSSSSSSSGVPFKSLSRSFRTTLTAAAEDGTSYKPFGVRDDHLKTFYRDPAYSADDVLENFKVSLLRMAHLQGSTDAAMEVLEKRNEEMRAAIEEMRAMRLGDGDGESEDKDDVESS